MNHRYVIFFRGDYSEHEGFCYDGRAVFTADTYAKAKQYAEYLAKNAEVSIDLFDIYQLNQVEVQEC